MPKPSFTEAQMEKCLQELAKKDGRSFRKVCLDSNIAGSSVRTRLNKEKQLESGKKPVKMGRPTIIPETEEKELADCIAVLCKNGFSPTLDDIRLIVQDYVTSNNIENPFVDGKPGRRWMERFLVKNNLTLKRATFISKVRLYCISNPFLIYDFYKELSDVVTDEELTAAQIWNMDETGFCIDPKKSMTVAPKGHKALKRTEGCQRENVTVLAVCSASGRVLDPLIINQGAYFQQCWKADNALPNTFYGHSPNGWVTSQVMMDWFEKFLDLVQERPLLLLFDGHSTHFSIDVVKKALDNQVILIKLPPHTTDLMQPLDVGMFSPLKKAWDKLLTAHTGFGGTKGTIRRADFVNMLCSIWKESMPGKNAIAGFRATGMFPVDMGKYPEARFDIRMMEKFNAWSNAGKPDDRAKFLDDKEPPEVPEVPEVPAVQPLEVEPLEASDLPTCSSFIDLEEPIASTPARNLSEGVHIPPITDPAPPGYQWKYLLVLVPKTEETRHKSFEESILDIAKPPQPRKKQSRKRIGYNKTVLSTTDFLAELEKKEEEKRQKEEKKAARQKAREEKKETVRKGVKGKGKSAKQFRNKFVKMADENSEDSIDDDFQPNSEDDNDDNNVDDVNDEEHSCDSGDGTDQTTEDLQSEEDQYGFISNVWKAFSLPITENEIVGEYVGAIFVDIKVKQHLYVGKITRRFLNDNQGLPAALELDCLKPKHGSSNDILESIPPHLAPDVDVFPMHNIISKPLDVSYKGNNKFEVPGYPQLLSTYGYLKTMDRISAHKKFVCQTLNADD